VRGYLIVRLRPTSYCADILVGGFPRFRKKRNAVTKNEQIKPND
jgi:hypothetical protein